MMPSALHRYVIPRIPPDAKFYYRLVLARVLADLQQRKHVRCLDY
jgi:hypothetical protein